MTAKAEAAPLATTAEPAPETPAPAKKPWLAGYEREFEYSFHVFLACLFTILPLCVGIGVISGYIVVMAIIGVVITILACIWGWGHPD